MKIFKNFFTSLFALLSFVIFIGQLDFWNLVAENIRNNTVTYFDIITSTLILSSVLYLHYLTMPILIPLHNATKEQREKIFKGANTFYKSWIVNGGIGVGYFLLAIYLYSPFLAAALPLTTDELRNSHLLKNDPHFFTYAITLIVIGITGKIRGVVEFLSSHYIQTTIPDNLKTS